MTRSLPFTFGTLTAATLVALWTGLPPTGALLRLITHPTEAAAPLEADARAGTLSPEEIELAARVVWSSTESSTLTPDDPPEELPEIFSERDPRPVWVTVVTDDIHTHFGREMNLYRALRLATSRVMKDAGKAPIRCIRVEIATHLRRADFDLEAELPAHWAPGREGLGREDDEASSWIGPLSLLDKATPVARLINEEIGLTFQQQWRSQVKVNTSPLVHFDSLSFVTHIRGDRPKLLYRGRPELANQSPDHLSHQVDTLIVTLQTAGVVPATSPAPPLDEALLYPRIPPPAPDYVGTPAEGQLPPTTVEVARGLRFLVKTAPPLTGMSLRKRTTSLMWMASWLVTHQRGAACDGLSQPGVMDRGLMDWSPDPEADQETLAALLGLRQLWTEFPAFGAFSIPSN